MSNVLQRGTATAGRADGQCGVRHDRAGADAHIPLEEGRAIPGSRMKNSTA